MRLRALTPADLPDVLEDLAEILAACVADGASVGFVMPFGIAQARAFWQEAVFDPVRAGDRVLWVAEDGGRCVGTVQLVLASMPNQTHKAEVAKMLVHPQWRRRGIGNALMQALIARARAEGRQMLLLDTRSGDAAQRLYAACGFRAVAEIPDYALAPEGTGRLDPTTFMIRHLGPQDA